MSTSRRLILGRSTGEPGAVRFDVTRLANHAGVRFNPSMRFSSLRAALFC